jgi:hypothetical protein
MFRVSNGSFTGVNVMSVPKASLLAGSANNATVLTGAYATTGVSAHPAISLNNAPLPELLVSASGGTATLSKIVGPIATPSIQSVASVSVPSMSTPPDGAQKGSSTLIDTGDGRVGGSAVIRSGVLWTTQPTDVGGRSAVLWYKIDTSSNTLLQSGVISDPSAAFYYPSIAVNGVGQAVIGFTASSSTRYASSYAAVGSTVAGVTTFGSPIPLENGTASYAVVEPGPGGRNRWGDYSATTVDPSDPRRFWTIQEWASATNIWSTQITELILPLPLPGDANEDGKVDGGDLALWQQNYDPLGLKGDNNTWAKGDWNGDRRIDGGDLALWQQNYSPLGYLDLGSPAPLPAFEGAASVPEPATATLLGASLAMLLRLARGRKTRPSLRA